MSVECFSSFKRRSPPSTEELFLIFNILVFFSKLFFCNKNVLLLFKKNIRKHLLHFSGCREVQFICILFLKVSSTKNSQKAGMQWKKRRENPTQDSPCLRANLDSTFFSLPFIPYSYASCHAYAHTPFDWTTRISNSTEQGEK